MNVRPIRKRPAASSGVKSFPPASASPPISFLLSDFITVPPLVSIRPHTTQKARRAWEDALLAFLTRRAFRVELPCPLYFVVPYGRIIQQGRPNPTPSAQARSRRTRTTHPGSPRWRQRGNSKGDSRRNRTISSEQRLAYLCGIPAYLEPPESDTNQKAAGSSPAERATGVPRDPQVSPETGPGCIPGPSCFDRAATRSEGLYRERVLVEYSSSSPRPNRRHSRLTPDDGCSFMRAGSGLRDPAGLLFESLQG